MTRRARVKRLLAATFLAMTLAGNITLLFINYDTLQAARDEQLLSEARKRILAIRRGTIELDFGIGNASKELIITQRSHAFRFGCNAYQYDLFNTSELNQKYNDLFSAMFNYATVPFYWTTYEWNRGEFLYEARLHNMTSWLHGFNATAKGHPIIWQSEDVVPPWMEALDQAAQHDAALDHIDRVLAQFPEIHAWDLVNEMTHVPNTWLGSTPEETWEVAVERARAARNDCEFIANEYTIGDGQSPDPFYDFVSKVVLAGDAPDALGFQFHTIEQWYPLDKLVSTLDRFGTYKIPIHITEFLPGSKGKYNDGTRGGEMTEATQAEWAARAYTMLFSHPAVDAITWWDFSDAAWSAWMAEKGAYMMAPDGRVLPVYGRLFDLVHVQWNSSCTIQLDGAGKCSFTGYYGNYSFFVEGGASGAFQIVDNRPANARPWTTGDVYRLST
nr:endo-1,4-beta-xylanase [Candidatus Sigynarchaeum springense]